MKSFLFWTLALITVSVLFSSVADAEEANLRCSRCPAVCTSAHSYQLSCHNACRSLNPRLTEVRCEGNKCTCKEPSTTATTASSSPKKKKNKIFG